MRYHSSSLPQSDPKPAERLAAIAHARALNQFDFSYFDVGFVKEVPFWDKMQPTWYAKASVLSAITRANVSAVSLLDPNLHPFMDSVRKGIRRILSNKAVFGQAPNMPGKRDPLAKRAMPSPADYLGLFRLIEPPTAAWCFATDWWFAWQRVGGHNPLLLRRARPGDLGRLGAFSEERVQHTMGESLEQMAADKRLYFCDFDILRGLEATRAQGSNPRQYLPNPLAVFARRPGSVRLEPVGIAMRHQEREPVFYPDDGESWNMACIAVQVADSNHHGVVMHNVACHLTMAWLCLATRRSLAPWHPIARLLEPHFEGTLMVNLLTRDLVIPGGRTPALQSLNVDGTMELIRRAIEQARWNAESLPNDLERRGVATTDELPIYPPRDDGMPLWKAVRRFVERYVDLYYASEAEVQADTELANWMVELQSEEGARLKDIGEVDDNGVGWLKTRKGLTDLVAQIIFRATGIHNMINYSVYESMGFAPNVPAAAYFPPPSDEDGHYTRKDTVAMLPPYAKAIGQIEDTYLVSQLYIKRLGQYRRRHFRDERVWELIRRYQAELVDIEAQIDRINPSRPAPYNFLKPSLIAQSVVV